MLFRAKANKALDRAEDPREMLDYSYERQLELLQQVRLPATRKKKAISPEFTQPCQLSANSLVPDRITQHGVPRRRIPGRVDVGPCQRRERGGRQDHRATGLRAQKPAKRRLQVLRPHRAQRNRHPEAPGSVTGEFSRAPLHQAIGAATARQPLASRAQRAHRHARPQTTGRSRLAGGQHDRSGPRGAPPATTWAGGHVVPGCEVLDVRTRLAGPGLAQ